MKISHRALSAALFIVPSLTVTPLVHAEDLAEDLAANSTGENRTIIVTGTTSSDIAQEQVKNTAGGAEVITQDDYADKYAVSLRDSLAFSPGVYTQPRYGQEVRISIRGSGLSRGNHLRGIVLLQDGVPINLADDSGDFQELDAAFFDHLEVYRGGNALRFGSGTLGGAINGVTPTGQTASGVYLRGDTGSFNSFRGLASAGGIVGQGDVWAAVSAETSDGDREHAKRRSLRFHGNVGLKISEVVATRFYASVNNIDQEIPGLLTAAQTLTNPRQANPLVFARDQARDIDSFRLQNRTSFNWGSAKLDVGAFINARTLYHPIFQVIDEDSVDRGIYARADYDGGIIAATLGGEFRFGTTDARRFVNVAGGRGALTFDADRTARTANIYGELRVKPITGVSFIAGGIYADGFRAQHLLFNGSVQNIEARAEYSEFSPKFGLLWDAASDIQFYANYNRSAELPGFTELGQINQFVPLRAQTAWTAEIGTRGSHGIASWDISAYRADISGEILQFNVGPDIPASTFNANKTRHQGIEFGISLQPAAWLRLRQIYQYNDFRFRADRQYGDNRLPVAPPHVLRSEIRLGTERFHVSPNAEWIAKGAFADYNNSVRTGSYVLFGLSAGAKITDGIDAFIDARNIADKAAIGDISAVVQANPASVIYSPAERRAIFGGLRARF